ncbi:globin domain-containing protein [Lolliginicoccus suaedae]|uniref:globin domain-containing protein n=1 Tax=Lolliginicoccus suaedae TaxID=2605429 RepID=UPI0011EC25DC|nr:globin domain-containing protein [Lolliginicoccus suaedae]
MLSTASRETIRATLPVVGAHLDAITTTFYRRMFAARPELERDLFNRGNQHQGEQQKALAGAVAAFASLQLDPDPERVALILSRIAHKHASLGVTAEQYWIVHEHLFAAIVEILGEAVTPEVASAWDEVYWLMAHTLIDLENGLYARSGVQPGEVWRTVRVARRELQSADAVTFTLTALPGEELPRFAPGQYISVGAHLPDGARQIRQYSLCGSPSDETWRITIKRVPASIGPDGSTRPAGEVSNHLYNTVFEGDELSVTTPFGDLELIDDGSPVLLASAGIGCTPMLGMLHHLASSPEREREVAIVHADRSLADHAHRRELEEVARSIPGSTLHRWYETITDEHAVPALVRAGRADIAELPVREGTRAYLCGPLPFMMSLREGLIARGVPASRIHYEVFGPDSWSAR